MSDSEKNIKDYMASYYTRCCSNLQLEGLCQLKAEIETNTLRVENAAMREAIEEVYIEFNLYMEGINKGAFNSEEEAAEGRNRIFMGILKLAEMIRNEK